jgi:hypothetical protein
MARFYAQFSPFQNRPKQQYSTYQNMLHCSNVGGMVPYKHGFRRTSGLVGQ